MYDPAEKCAGAQKGPFLEIKNNMYFVARQDGQYLFVRNACTSHSTNSKISPGWQFNALQMASSVLKRTAFAFPVFKIDRLDKVKSTFSESSFSDIFLLAIMTSRFTDRKSVV